jgi:hypothetical protein
MQKLPADYQPALRRCLGIGCGRTFRSLGPGLRFCPSCARKRASADLARRHCERVKDVRG